MDLCSAPGVVLRAGFWQLRGERRDAADLTDELRIPSGTAENQGTSGLMM
jgi:hypothetical protein